MAINERGFLANERFTLQMQTFDFQGSAALSKNEQRIFINEQTDAGVQQLVVQLSEGGDANAKPRAVDGIAQSLDLLIVFLDPRRFFGLLELLYASRDKRRTVRITLTSDDEGRINTIAARAFDASEHPGADDLTVDPPPEPLEEWVA